MGTSPTTAQCQGKQNKDLKKMCVRDLSFTHCLSFLSKFLKGARWKIRNPPEASGCYGGFCGSYDSG